MWDTGHQAYVHKLVTGRRRSSPACASAAASPAIPNRAESAHDLVENSHASTALSYAYGLAQARQLRRDPRRVVAVVGDGALTGGVAYEALNNIGTSGANVVVVLNDNGRSYAPTVSRLSSAAMPPRLPAARRRATSSRRSASATSGRSTATISTPSRRRCTKRRRGAGPVVLHVHTAKGRGYEPAERDEEKCLHDIGPFDTDTGVALAASAGPPELHRGVRRRLSCARPPLVPSSSRSPPPCRDRRD